MKVAPIPAELAAKMVVQHHYLHRRPPISYAYGLIVDTAVRGVVTYGVPASRHLQMSACPGDPDQVLELNRLWVHDSEPANTESWFVSRSLRLLPPRIVVSYADTKQGHVGYIYRALNFNYAGWTDMDRKTPRFDYVSPGLHSRAAFRSGSGLDSKRVRRLPKVRYWTTTGNRTERRGLSEACGWPSLDWKTCPPPLAVGP